MASKESYRERQENEFLVIQVGNFLLLCIRIRVTIVCRSKYMQRKIYQIYL